MPISLSARAPTCFHSVIPVGAPHLAMLPARSLRPRAQATSGASHSGGPHRRPVQRAPPPSALTFVQPTSLSNSSSNYSSGSLEAPSCPWPQPGPHMPQPAPPKGVWAALFGGFEVRYARAARISWGGCCPSPATQRANRRFPNCGALAEPAVSPARWPQMEQLQRAEAALPPEMERVMRFTDGPGAVAEPEEPNLLLRLWRYQGP